MIGVTIYIKTIKLTELPISDRHSIGSQLTKHNLIDVFQEATLIRSTKEQIDLILRRTVEVHNKDTLIEKLNSGRKLVIKFGADPSRPDLHLGICGEHGGEPSSVEFCHNVGLDYVSCSPFRVPLARLAAAQAAIKAGMQNK